MSADPRKHQLGTRLDFPEWEAVLEAAPLSKQMKDGHAITVRWYLSWCRRGRVAVDHGSAREFIEWVVVEKKPQAWQVEQWKEALGWYSCPLLRAIGYGAGSGLHSAGCFRNVAGLKPR